MLKRLYRTVYRLLMIRWNHIRYAKKIGVNMLGGGGTSLWSYWMGNRTLAYYSWL